jgi:hypothetical protein
MGFFRHPGLNTNAFLNEKESVLTSFSLFASAEQTKIEFGTYFRKAYAAELYAELLKEFRSVLADAVKMVMDAGKLVPVEEVQARKSSQVERQASTEATQPVASTKPMTIKEKQDFIVKLFAREHKECTLKIEDAERLRLYGKGLVFAISKERVDLIFVHYDAFQSRMEEVKTFIANRHPDLKTGFQYNRINMKLEFESDITKVFYTLREAITSFHLIQ